MVNSWYFWKQKFHHRKHLEPMMTSAFVNLVSFNRNCWTELLYGQCFLSELWEDRLFSHME
jgi:hypothetical protein